MRTQDSAILKESPRSRLAEEAKRVVADTDISVMGVFNKLIWLT